MIQSALPQAAMSAPGFTQVIDQLQSTNDFTIAKQAAAQQWRQTHGQTLDGFESAWNSNVTPGAFLVRRLSDNPAALQTMATNLQNTPEGRATLKQLMARVQWARTNGVFDALGQ